MISFCFRFKIPIEKIVKNSEDKCNEQLDDQNDGPPQKKHKRQKGGMNKNRPVFRESIDEKLCRSVISGSDEKCSRVNCKFQHDLTAFFEKKPPDIADKCYIYSTKGFCPYGVTCRFATTHLDENLKNIQSNEQDNSTAERFDKFYELQAKLRKKTYDFSKASEILKDVETLMHKEKLLGSASDDETIKTRPAEKKKIDFRNKLVLSPLTTVGNLPFRRICKEYGADITCGEMSCAFPLLNGSQSEFALVRRHVSEDIFGVQLCGNNAKIITQAAQILTENYEVDYIDLNIGCPIDLIYNQGGGSALIRRPNVLETIVRSCSALLQDKPFTVKTRTGIYANKSVAHELIPKIEQWGAAAVTIHGRSREQRYTKNADWNYIEKCAASVKEMPVIGNGDILSLDDYQHAREVAPHLSSVMIGRGALIKPWLFKEIKEGKSIDISCKERFEMLQKYVNYGLEHWGSDTKGIETVRRFLLEWQSFLYRYVPYGILANPPQKIQQRPENDSYLGRDDLETLMTSNKSSDWIKISEMFLGKVPEGFSFMPKHKANAY